MATIVTSAGKDAARLIGQAQWQAGMTLVDEIAVMSANINDGKAGALANLTQHLSRLPCEVASVAG